MTGWTGVAAFADSNCGRGGKRCAVGLKCDIHPVCCPVKTKTDDGKPICCKAMTASCMACAAGKIIPDYCKEKLTTGNIKTAPECKEAWYKAAKAKASAAYDACKKATPAAIDVCRAAAFYTECIALDGSETDCKDKEASVKDKTNVADSTKIDQTFRDDAVTKTRDFNKECIKNAGTDAAKAKACRQAGDDTTATATDLAATRDDADKDAFLDSLKACGSSAADDASRAQCKCNAEAAQLTASGMLAKACDAVDTNKSRKEGVTKEVHNSMTSCTQDAGTDRAKHEAFITAAKTAACELEGSCDTTADDKKDAVTKTDEDTDFKKKLVRAADDALKRRMATCMNGNSDGVKTAADKDALYAKCKEAGKADFAAATGKGADEIDGGKINEALDRGKTSQVTNTMNTCVGRKKADKAALTQADYDECKTEAKEALGGQDGNTAAEVDQADLNTRINDGAVSQFANVKAACNKRAGGDAAKIAASKDVATAADQSRDNKAVNQLPGADQHAGNRNKAVNNTRGDPSRGMVNCAPPGRHAPGSSHFQWQRTKGIAALRTKQPVVGPIATHDKNLGVHRWCIQFYYVSVALKKKVERACTADVATTADQSRDNKTVNPLPGADQHAGNRNKVEQHHHRGHTIGRIDLAPLVTTTRNARPAAAGDRGDPQLAGVNTTTTRTHDNDGQRAEFDKGGVFNGETTKMACTHAADEDIEEVGSADHVRVFVALSFAVLVVFTALAAATAAAVDHPSPGRSTGGSVGSSAAPVSTIFCNSLNAVAWCVMTVRVFISWAGSEAFRSDDHRFRSGIARWWLARAVVHTANLPTCTPTVATKLLPRRHGRGTTCPHGAPSVLSRPPPRRFRGTETRAAATFISLVLLLGGGNRPVYAGPSTPMTNEVFKAAT